MVKWLGLHVSTAGGPGLIPGQGGKTLQASQHGQKKKKQPPENKQMKKITADPQNLKNSTQHEQAVKRLVEWTMNKQI